MWPILLQKTIEQHTYNSNIDIYFLNSFLAFFQNLSAWFIRICVKKEDNEAYWFRVFPDSHVNIIRIKAEKKHTRKHTAAM